ncbi:MAG: 30S ribosomal protein S10 [Candidatus Vogelbacteria bacterium]|nr:30S ribosomal protein S10 [Candidatus Vogelbacteria bacterium]
MATVVSEKSKTVVKKKSVSKLAPKEVPVSDKMKLRIRISAYEHKILDASVKQIIDTANRYDATIEGPVPLPTSIKKYTVNRGSFIDKNSREQFEMRTHRRLIDIISPSQKVVEALTNLNLPSGVNIDVKML